MYFDQDLRLNLWYEFGNYELNPRVRCAFGNVYIIWEIQISQMKMVLLYEGNL